MSSRGTYSYRQVAQAFARALAARDYPKAYAMTSQSFRNKVSEERLQAEFEAIVPTDWGAIGPVEAGESIETWPGRQSSDLGRVYVSIGGDVYSEAVIVVVTMENGKGKIREVEFGRP